MVPEAKTVALLTTEVAGMGALYKAAIRDAAHTLWLELFEAAWRDNSFDAAFKGIEGKRPDAILVQRLSPHYARRAEIVKFARRMQLPDFHGYTEAVEGGALCSYSSDLLDMFRRVAGYADRILKGARPADLAIEQPTRFEFAINLKTAKALGLKISPAVLQRADRVIE